MSVRGKVHRKKAIRGMEFYIPPHATINGKYKREHDKFIAKAGTSAQTDRAEEFMQSVNNNFISNVNYIREYYGLTWKSLTTMFKKNYCAMNPQYYYRNIKNGKTNSIPFFQVCLVCVLFKVPVQVMMFEDIRENLHLIGFKGFM